MHFVQHCTEVSVNKVSLSSSPIPPNQLIQIINDAPRPIAEGGMKGRLRAPYPTARWHWQMQQKLPPKGMWLQMLLSPSLMPLPQSLGWSPQYLSSGITFPCPTAVHRGHFGQEGVVCQERSTPCCSRGTHHQWPASSRHDRSHSSGGDPLPVSWGCDSPPCSVSPGATGCAPWAEQGRGLILQSLLDFNWKRIYLWLNFLSCLSWSLVDQKKCKLKENILDVPDFKVEHE